MTLVLDPQPIPLRADQDGTLRVGETRVLLELVIHAFNAGKTPEEIVMAYETLRLEDVYAVITYYLYHRIEVDAYIVQRVQETEGLWEEIHGRADYQSFREKLLQRRSDY